MKCAVVIKKLKSKAVGHIEEHNARKVAQKHTDASKQHLNKFLLSKQYNSFAEAIDDKISTLATKQKRKVRSDAVVLVDIVLVASPEYFRPNCVDNWGFYEEDKLKAYTQASLEFLKKEYGDRLISVSLHVDEATPHIHANVVPITSDGRLSAKDMFNKFELSKLQDKYAESMKHLGLERGDKKTAHIARKEEYYRQNRTLKEEVKEAQKEVEQTQEENRSLKAYISEHFRSLQNHVKSFVSKFSASTDTLQNKTASAYSDSLSVSSADLTSRLRTKLEEAKQTDQLDNETTQKLK